MPDLSHDDLPRETVTTFHPYPGQPGTISYDTTYGWLSWQHPDGKWGGRFYLEKDKQGLFIKINVRDNVPQVVIDTLPTIGVSARFPKPPSLRRGRRKTNAYFKLIEGQTVDGATIVRRKGGYTDYRLIESLLRCGWMEIKPTSGLRYYTTPAGLQALNQLTTTPPQGGKEQTCI